MTTAGRIEVCQSRTINLLTNPLILTIENYVSFCFDVYMRSTFLVLSCAFVLPLVACSSVEDRQARANALLGDITQKAEQVGTSVTETAKNTVEMAKEGVEAAKELKERADTVAEGVSQIQEGLSGE